MSQNIQFDVVIPVHKKDLAILEYCIKSVRKKLVGARRIIIVSKEKYSNNAEWFDEGKYPFSYQEVSDLVDNNRVGWHYQQLLKLYAPLIIDDIAENVLILDSDTVFFKKVKMFDEKNRALYNLGKDTDILIQPFNIGVDRHIDELLPEISRKNLPEDLKEISGIAHNMMFNRKMMQELFAKIEKKHGDKFYKVALKLARKSGYNLSEYQIYFNFLAIFHREKIKLRRLKYKNTADVNIRKYQRRFKYHYCSFHSYMRNSNVYKKRNKFVQFFSYIFNKLFISNEYNIGVVKSDISNFLTIPNQEIKWLNLAAKNIISVFFIKNNAKNYIFYLTKTKQNLSRLEYCEIDENLTIRNRNFIKNFDDFEYFYPFFHEDNNYFLANKDNELTIFKLNSDFSYQKINVVAKDISIKNFVLIKKDQQYYILFSKNNCSELNVMHSQDLFSGWKISYKIAVKNEIANQDVVGEIIYHNSEIYYLSKNNLNPNNVALKINKISELSSDKFESSEEIEINPNQLSKYDKSVDSIIKMQDFSLIVGSRKKILFF